MEARRPEGGHTRPRPAQSSTLRPVAGFLTRIVLERSRLSENSSTKTYLRTLFRTFPMPWPDLGDLLSYQPPSPPSTAC